MYNNRRSSRKYYAVRDGRSPGIYSTWDECKQNVNGYSGAKFKSFSTLEEANRFVNEDNSSSGYSGGYSGNRNSYNSGSGYSGGYSSNRNSYSRSNNYNNESSNRSSYRSSNDYSFSNNYNNYSRNENNYNSNSGYNDSSSDDDNYNNYNSFSFSSATTRNDNKSSSAKAYVDGSYNVFTQQYGAGVHFDHNGKTSEISQRGENPDAASMRNVAGEILGAELAMKKAYDEDIKNLDIYYDYNGIESWCTGEWKANKEYTQRYRDIYNEISKKVNIKFHKVKGHSGDQNNERADQLAKNAVF